MVWGFARQPWSQPAIPCRPCKHPGWRAACGGRPSNKKTHPCHAVMADRKTFAELRGRPASAKCVRFRLAREQRLSGENLYAPNRCIRMESKNAPELAAGI